MIHPCVTPSSTNQLLSYQAFAFRNLPMYHSDVPIPQSPLPSTMLLLLAALAHLLLESILGSQLT